MGGLKRGMKVTTRNGSFASYGSHRDGWTHKFLDASTVFTVVRLDAWNAYLVSDDGGHVALPKSLVTIVDR